MFLCVGDSRLVVFGIWTWVVTCCGGLTIRNISIGLSRMVNGTIPGAIYLMLNKTNVRPKRIFSNFIIYFDVRLNIWELLANEYVH